MRSLGAGQAHRCCRPPIPTGAGPLFRRSAMLPYQEVFRMRGRSGLLILIATLTAQAASTEEAARKVLASRCWACHAQMAMGGLRLDSRDAMLRGGKSGPAIVPGDAAKSRLYQAVSRALPSVRPMPPDAVLSPDELATVGHWINEGASW